MKVVVFAHTPPPHHGQSFMVQVLLDQFSRGNTNGKASTSPLQGGQVECYHVNCRFSEGIEDIGRVQFHKPLLLLKYCATAIWYRFRYRVPNFYYVPAPSRRAALIRDWMVMILCRPFFRNIIFHWHAVGLGEWLDHKARPFERFLTKKLLGHHQLSIVLGDLYRSDAQRLDPERIEVIPNAIPDPCPRFETDILPRRIARLAAREKLIAGEPLTDDDLQRTGKQPEIFRVLYLSLCTREKGLFDAIEGIALINRKLESSGSPLRVHLTVAGKFWHETEQEEFNQRIAKPDLNNLPANGKNTACAVEYRGFVTGDEKKTIFEESDCYCFPSYYESEAHPVSVVEAMAYGLPIIAAKWRMLPELFPNDYIGLVETRAPDQIAAAIEQFLVRNVSESMRKRFLENYVDSRYAERIRDALKSLGE